MSGPWKSVFLFCVFLFSVSPAGAAKNCRGYLNSDEIARLKESKALVREVDLKSLDKTVQEMERSACPPMNAIIFETVARTYDDIVREKKVTEKKNKDWLYSKIQLNMAYLQLTGGQIPGDTDPLNRMIRYKLKEYLTEDILSDPRFFHKVEELLEE